MTDAELIDELSLLEVEVLRPYDRTLLRHAIQRIKDCAQAEYVAEQYREKIVKPSPASLPR